MFGKIDFLLMKNESDVIIGRMCLIRAEIAGFVNKNTQYFFRHGFLQTKMAGDIPARRWTQNVYILSMQSYDCIFTILYVLPLVKRYSGCLQTGRHNSGNV